MSFEFKRPDKFAKRPEFVDVDNAKHGREYSRIYRRDAGPSLGAIFPAVNASRSGRLGALPRQGRVLGAGGDVTPVQARNRISPNKLEEHQ